MALADSSAPPRSALAYQPSLDGLRALAVAAVIAYHLDLPWAPRGGAVGVTLFFSLSGYLITTLLLRELAGAGRIRLAAFYARRALRLFPALLLLVGCVAVYAAWFGPEISRERELGTIPYVLGYVGNWYRAVEGFGTLGLLDHTWTLSVEEQFYLLWPPILLGVLRWGSRRLLWVVLAVGCAGPLVLRLLLWDGLASAARVLNGTDTAADPLLMGCALAVALSAASVPGLARLRTAAAVAVWPATALLLADGVLRLDGNDLPTGVTITLLWGPTALGLASTVVVGAVVLRPPGWLAVSGLRALGRISYGLYLWHYPVIRVLEERSPEDLSGAEQVLAVALTLGAAGLSYILLERPLLGLKRLVPPAAPVDRERVAA